MKANELRIGNYILFGGLVHSLQSVGQCLSTNITIDEIPIDRCTPIPLTEEWLLGFGFEGDKDERHIVLGLGGGEELSLELLTKTCCLTRSKKNDKDDFVYIKYPEYVHNLQNLFHSLTGKDLTIK